MAHFIGDGAKVKKKSEIQLPLDELNVNSDSEHETE